MRRKSGNAGFHPEHYPNDGEIEKENDVRNLAISKGNGDDGGAAGDGPVGRDVEALSPDHDAPELAAIEMRHGIDVARSYRLRCNEMVASSVEAESVFSTATVLRLTG